MIKIVVTAAVALLLSACASTVDKISGTPIGAYPIPITDPTIVTDLQSAAFNLDSAVSVGALAPDDPAPKCLHSVLVKAGIEEVPGVEPAKSFVPKKDGVASAGAIAYILAQQAKQLTRSTVPVDPNCEALVGRIVIDGAKAFNKTVVPLIFKSLL